MRHKLIFIAELLTLLWILYAGNLIRNPYHASTLCVGPIEYVHGFGHAIQCGVDGWLVDSNDSFGRVTVHTLFNYSWVTTETF